jgi:hypothetical protein
MPAVAWPIHRRRNRVTKTSSTAAAIDAPTTPKTVASDGGVPSRVYLMAVRKLNNPASAKETATK